MQLKFFRVDAEDPTSGEGELNKFLRSHRVLTIEKSFVKAMGVPAYWSVAVEYLEMVSGKEVSPSAGKTDFREILNDQDFALFCKLKDVRKGMAEEAGVPVYSIFTNRHLADMAQGRFSDVAGISSIHGVGEKRAGKHAAPFILTIKNFEGNGVDQQDSPNGEPPGGFSEGRTGEAG
jgi:superfamily II DNA helicase RecQ